MPPNTFDNMFLRPWERGRKSHLLIKRAKGIYVWNGSDKRLIDLTSGLFNLPFGHAPEPIISAITNQLKQVDYAGPSYALEIRSEACKRLFQITQRKYNSFFFAPGGAEAIEGAMKFARHFSGKMKLVSADNSYHGATYGAQALSGDPDRKKIIGSPSGIVYFKSADFFLQRGFDQESAKNMALESLEKNISNSGGVFLEAFTGVNSFFESPKGYLSEVQKICHENNSLLILDEILTGFGRTGKMFAYEHQHITPDIVCVGKNLTSGLIPQGAVCLSDELTSFVQKNPLPLGHTYMGHPAACAATVATIQQFKRQKILFNVQREGKRLRTSLNSILPDGKTLRGNGLLQIIEKFPFSEKQLLEMGILAHFENSRLALAPPLNIRADETNEIISKIKNVYRD